jgi:hypothetical protein
MSSSGIPGVINRSRYLMGTSILIDSNGKRYNLGISTTVRVIDESGDLHIMHSSANNSIGDNNNGGNRDNDYNNCYSCQMRNYEEFIASTTSDNLTHCVLARVFFNKEYVMFGNFGLDSLRTP